MGPESSSQCDFDVALTRVIPVLGTRLGRHSGSSFREEFLERALIDAVGDLYPGSTAISTGRQRITVPEWSRPMGGFDVRIRLPGSEEEEALVEAKVDDVDQVLWDLFKLAAGMTMPGVASGYLLVARLSSIWHRGECAELFQRSEQPICWDSAPMFNVWRAAWASLLRGGTARPLSVPSRIETMLLGSVEASGFEGYEVRVVSVRLVPNTEKLVFDGDWPLAS